MLQQEAANTGLSLRLVRWSTGEELEDGILICAERSRDHLSPASCSLSLSLCAGQLTCK